MSTNGAPGYVVDIDFFDLFSLGKSKLNLVKLVYWGMVYKSLALSCKTPLIQIFWAMDFVGENMGRRLSKEMHTPG